MTSQPQHSDFFPADSVVRRVHREAAVYAAGPRALLLQFAHPKVAAGLREHGALETKPVQRLLLTFRAMETMLFGTPDEALRASKRSATRHALVNGVLPQDVGRYRAGEPYCATDPDLLLWVLATLIDSSLLAYETLVARLEARDRERYYAEIVRACPLLGLTSEQMPPSYAAFRAYFDRTLSDGTLAVGDDGRALAASLLDARHLGGPLSVVARTLASAMLPAHLRAAFGLRWRAGERATSLALSATARAFVALAPRRIRELRPWDYAGNKATGGPSAASACPFSRLSAALAAGGRR